MITVLNSATDLKAFRSLANIAFGGEVLLINVIELNERLWSEKHLSVGVRAGEMHPYVNWLVSEFVLNSEVQIRVSLIVETVPIPDWNLKLDSKLVNHCFLLL